MSLFSIVKMVMDSNGWPTPINAVATSQDQNMRQAFALANKVLATVSYKKDWPVLIREHTFSTSNGQVGYDLPNDFHHLVAPSAMDAGQYFAMKGSMTPIQWYRKALNGGINWAFGFRIDAVGKQLQIAPTPSSPQNLVFMYITNLIAQDKDGNPVARYSQDTDRSVVDEEIVELGLSWRWRQKKGLDFTAEMAEFNGVLHERFAQYLGTGELPVAGPYMPSQITQPNTPDVFGV